MCGIVGLVSLNSGDYKLSDSIKHRGPDDYGFFRDGSVQFEHRRLSIIDTSQRGHQPMQTKDGAYTIVYNGEIYNYKDLQKELRLKGYTFDSESDTEVLLNGYSEFGSGVLNKLNGIFAFAIYDKKKQEVFIARDQFGIKPLYYFFKNGIFLFGSEIKSFLSHPQFDKSVNYDALFNYIQFMYCPGEITPFLHVKRLEPGHFMTISLKDAAIQVERPVSYFKLPFHGIYDNRSEADWIELLEEHLLSAVNSQLLSDVPLGFFLSGGLDSSLLVAMATKISNGRAPNCFTISSGAAMVKEGFSDDLHYAKRVASKLGAKLNVLDAEPNILNDFDKMIWHLDEPQADPAAIHVLNISKGARDLGIKVLLGGTAGDDIFTGYRRHLALNYEPFIQGSPLFLRKLLAYVADSLNSTHPKVRRLKKISRELPLDPSDRMAGYFAWLPSKDVFGLFNTEISSMLSLENISTGYYKHLLGKIPMEKDKVNQMLFLEMSTFLTNHNLNYTDKMSMAVGVETRVPYLDINVVNLSARIPSSLKLKGNTTKYLLKKVAEKYLPKDVVYRPKTGFGAPVREWVKNDLSEMISDRLSEQTIKKRGFLSGSAVNRLLKKNREGQEDNAYPIMALLAIESWFEQFIDR